MFTIEHYLMFKGNCNQAIELYKEAFGAKLLYKQTYGEAKNMVNFPIYPEMEELVMHSTIEIDGRTIMCGDSPDTNISGSNMNISVESDTTDKIQKAWDILKQEAQNINMELNQTFFAKLHGSLKDKFGINWTFTAEQIKH